MQYCKKITKVCYFIKIDLNKKKSFTFYTAEKERKRSRSLKILILSLINIESRPS